MELSNKRLTLEELDIVDKASEELDRLGETSIVCPRCGTPLHQEINGPGTVIKCETNNCIRITYRGI